MDDDQIARLYQLWIETSDREQYAAIGERLAELVPGLLERAQKAETFIEDAAREVDMGCCDSNSSWATVEDAIADHKLHCRRTAACAPSHGPPICTCPCEKCTASR